MSDEMLGDCTRGEPNGDLAAKTCSGLLRASTEWMSEKGDCMREAGVVGSSFMTRPLSDIREPPRGVWNAEGED